MTTAAQLRRPRWFNWLRAQVGGYFWLPCPMCRRNFGGHEMSSECDFNSMGVCEACAPLMREKWNKLTPKEIEDFFERQARRP